MSARFRAFGLSLLLGLAAPLGGYAANDWVTAATISPTSTLQSGRLCYTDGRDLACNDASGGLLSTSSTIHATAFVGDGSGLTGVIASTADRIVSGTTNMIAYASNGYISITQAGFNTAYFHPTLGLVAVGISSTGGLSGTTGGFTTGVTIGSLVPEQARALHVIGTGNLEDDIYLETISDTANGLFAFARARGTNDAKSNVQAGDIMGDLEWRGRYPSGYYMGARIRSTAVSDWSSGPNRTADLRFYTITSGTVSEKIRISPVGTGINTQTPTTALEVLGTISATNINTSGTLQVSNTVYATAFVGDGSGLTNITAASSDRIVSGTTNMIAYASNGYISITQAGFNTAYFHPTLGLVAVGVSSTGGLSGTTGYFGDNVSISGSLMAYKMSSDTSIDIRTNRSGSIYGNTYIRFTSPRSDTPDGGSNPGRGYIVLPGNSSSIAASLFVGANTANGAVTGDASAIRANQFNMELNSNGYVDFWRSGVNYARISTNGNGYFTGGNVGIRTATPTTALEVSGTISATAFVGDGSGLINISSSAITGLNPDRIVSGSAGVFVSNTGVINFRTTDTTFGYFDTNGILIVPGISTTSSYGISATSIYSDNDIRFCNGCSLLGNIRWKDSAWRYVDNGSGGIIKFQTTGGIEFSAARANNTLGEGALASPTRAMFITNDGKVSVGPFTTYSPASSFYVSGTTRVTSWTMLNANITPTTPLEVSGTVSATRFVGDGSGLTNVVASTADRIVSGTTNMIAYASNGYISITQAGFNTAYFHPTLGLVSVGVSSTGGLSGTTGYFGGNVGIGTTAPAAELEVRGTVSATAINTSGTLKVSNTVYATAFVGDGSGLTGVVASTGDRIVSGTTSMIAYTNNGYISVTQAGYNTAYFHPTLGLISVGVSSTGSISGTSGYFADGLLVGPGIPSTPLPLSAYGSSMMIYNNRTTNTMADDSNAVIQSQNGAALLVMSALEGRDITMSFHRTDFSNTSGQGAIIYRLSNNTMIFKASDSTIMSINNNGVGINTLSPTLALDVAGNARITSWTIINASTTPTAPLEVSGTISATNIQTSGTLKVSNTVYATAFVGDGSGLTNITAASSDRIVSGTTNMIAYASNGYISITQASYNTAYFHPTLGLVSVGVSSTGGLSGTTGYFGGNVGIGTTAPSATLHVSGTVRISGGSGAETCAGTNNYGTLRINPSTGKLQICRQ